MTNDFALASMCLHCNDGPHDDIHEFIIWQTCSCGFEVFSCILTDLRQLYFAVNKNMGIAGFFSSEYKKKLLWGSKKAAVEQVDLLVFEFMHRDFPNSLL
jgi:hypothetical protein